MLTKADFLKKIEETLSAYPQINTLYLAGDPRIRQNLEAQAAMFAMLSAQIETAQNEVFQKTRDSTVLADAAMRGIVRKGTPARIRIKCTNNSSEPFTVETGRNLFDSSGRVWHIETACTVEANATGTFEATQRTIETIQHTVQNSEPFYPIEIPAASDDAHLCSIRVRDFRGPYEYRDGYVNTRVNERVYHVEADERQRIYVRFGYKNVVGWQPEDGDKITLEISRTLGDIDIEYGSPFSFEYIRSPLESLVDLSMDALLVAGADPIAMSTLRDMAKYPSVYRHSAVFLGEFGFLLRREFPNLQFLSVWNESIEERARGANKDNINALFVAVLSSVGDEKVVVSDGKTVTPTEIAEKDLSDTQKAIREIIQKADDSYRVRFFTPVLVKIPMKIKARVATSYVASEVKSKIVEVLLTHYGKQATAARRGNMRPLRREIYDLLTTNVAALTDGDSDVEVTMQDAADDNNPELWRFVTEDSVDVTVVAANITRNTWGG